MPSAPISVGRAAPAVTLTLAAMAMIAPFSIDSIFPAFAQVGREFGADEVA